MVIQRWAVRARTVAVVASVGLLVACQQRVPTYDGRSSAGGIVDRVLTADGTDRYTFADSAGAMDVVALASNTGGNLRAVAWPRAQPADIDLESCATWSRSNGEFVQRGAVLRGRVMADRSLRALTVSQNIMFGFTWVFNVHSWNTASATPKTGIGQVDLGAYMSSRPPGALRLCARAVGDVVTVKLWVPTSEPEPRWDDSFHGGSVTLPARERVAGHAGWFIGHLEAFDAAAFRDLSTWAYRILPS